MGKHLHRAISLIKTIRTCPLYRIHFSGWKSLDAQIASNVSIRIVGSEPSANMRGFAADSWDHPDEITHRNRVFRRCRKDMATDHAPRCVIHRDSQNGDPNDPKETTPPDKKKEKKKKGLQPDQC
jgi:hypothetical protein